MTGPGGFHTDVPLGTKVGTRRTKVPGETPVVLTTAAPVPDRRQFAALQRGIQNRPIVRRASLHKAYDGCPSCTFYTGANTCFAYPQQIPKSYAQDGVVHTVTHDGTGGFTYRRVDTTDVVTKALDAGVGPHVAAWFADLIRDPSLVTKDAARPSERIVVGFMYPNAHPDGTLIVDRQGDVITMREMTKTVAKFMAGPRVLGVDHDRTEDDRPVRVGEVLESVVLTKQLRNQLGLPNTLELGWIGAARVDDEPTWQSVVAGERLAFSVGGKAARIAIADGVMPG